MSNKAHQMHVEFFTAEPEKAAEMFEAIWNAYEQIIIEAQETRYERDDLYRTLLSVAPNNPALVDADKSKKNRKKYNERARKHLDIFDDLYTYVLNKYLG